MNIKLASQEDLTITTKGGHTVTVPDADGTLALEGGSGQSDRIVSPNGKTWVKASDSGMATVDNDFVVMAVPAGFQFGGTGYAESGDVRLAGPYSYTSGSSTSYAWISEDIDPESFDPASHPGEGEPWHLFLLGDQPSEPTVVACSGGGSVYNIQAGSWSNKSPVLIRTFSDFNYRGGDVSVSNFSSRVVAVDTDVSLSVIYGEWSVTPSEYNGSPISIELVNGAWTPMCSGSQIGTSYQDTGQVVLDWPDGYAAIVMRATRTESYKLGDQSSKLLAPASVIGDINSVLDAINGEVI